MRDSVSDLFPGNIDHSRPTFFIRMRQHSASDVIHFDTVGLTIVIATIGALFAVSIRPGTPGVAYQREEITIRVTFTDYLTGRTFTAQKLCKVKVPPK